MTRFTCRMGSAMKMTSVLCSFTYEDRSLKVPTSLASDSIPSRSLLRSSKKPETSKRIAGLLVSRRASSKLLLLYPANIALRLSKAFIRK